MKIRKKALTIILALVLAIGLVACGGSSDSQETSQDQEESSQDQISQAQTDTNILEKIQDSGVMILGTSADYPPFEFHAVIDGQDQIVGFEMEVAKLLAEEMGVELEIQDVDFSTVLSGIQTGMYDIALAGINPNPERAEVMDFTNTYYEVEYTVLVSQDKKDQFTSPEDLEGLNLGVQNGTVQADVAEENFADSANITQLGKVTDLVLQLQGGMIDAIILEVPVAQSYERNNPDVAMAPNFSFEGIDFDSGVAMAIPKGQEDLLNYLNDFISKYTGDGTFDKLYEEAVSLNEQVSQ